MDTLEPTTYSPSCSSSSLSEQDDSRAAEEVLTNKTLLKLILKHHYEIRVRLVVIQPEDDQETPQANQVVGKCGKHYG